MHFEAFGTWINNNAITIEGGLISGKRVSLSPYHIYIDLVNLEDRSDLVNFNGPLGNGGCYIGGTWANAAPLNQCPSFSFRFFYPIKRAR